MKSMLAVTIKCKVIIVVCEDFAGNSSVYTNFL